MAVETNWYYSPFPSLTVSAEPSGDITPVDLAFDPSQPAPDTLCPPIIIYRSAGAPVVRFVPGTPFGAIASEWAVRIGTRTTTLITLTSGSGLIVDEDNGTITVNPSAAQTLTLPLDQVVWLELWRTGPGDDNTTPVVRRRVNVLRTHT